MVARHEGTLAVISPSSMAKVDLSGVTFSWAGLEGCLAQAWLHAGRGKGVGMFRSRGREGWME